MILVRATSLVAARVDLRDKFGHQLEFTTKDRGTIDGHDFVVCTMDYLIRGFHCSDVIVIGYVGEESIQVCMSRKTKSSVLDEDSPILL